MHLRNVAIFCDVVSRKSFSKGAQAQNVSQSSASQAVHVLEASLGTQLIDRSKRPFELTPAGEVYFEGCRKLLEEFRRVEDQVQQMKNKVRGRVRIAAIYSVGLLQLDVDVRRFRERYPDVEVCLEYLHPNDVYDRIRADEADIGLVSFPRDGGDLRSIPWQEQEMVLVVPPGHVLAGRKSATVAQLDGEDIVTFTQDLSIRKNMERWFRQAKVNLNVVHEFDNIENIKRAVEIGTGVALLPEPTVRRECETGSLHAVKLKNTNSWRRPLGIVHRRHKTLSTAVKKFVELLQEHPEEVEKRTNGSPASHPSSEEAPAGFSTSRTGSAGRQSRKTAKTEK